MKLPLKNLLIIFGLLLFILIIPPSVKAGKLFLVPAKESYQIGDIFIVEVRMDTEGEHINVVEANLTFSPSSLQVEDFSQGNSILTLWVKRPDIVDTKGTLSFSGGIPGGFQGSSGFLGRIIFRAIKNGQARVNFQKDNSQILLSDGRGTIAGLKTSSSVFNILDETLATPQDLWQVEINLDKIIPEPFQPELNRDHSVAEGKYFIIFSAIDKQTGIDHYEIKEGDGKWQTAQSPYFIDKQFLGKEVQIKAVDKAGNERIEKIVPVKKNLFIKWTVIIITLLLVLYYFLFKALRK